MEYNPNKYKPSSTIFNRDSHDFSRSYAQREPSRGSDSRNNSNIFSPGSDSISRTLVGASGLNAAYSRTIPVKHYDYGSNAMPPIFSKKTESYNINPAAAAQSKPDDNILTRDIARKNALQSPQIRFQRGGATIERNLNKEEAFSRPQPAAASAAASASISINDRGTFSSDTYMAPGSRSGNDSRFMNIGAQIKPLGLSTNGIRNNYNDSSTHNGDAPLSLPDDSPYRPSKTLGENYQPHYGVGRLADKLRSGSKMTGDYRSNPYDRSFDEGPRHSYTIAERPARDGMPAAYMDTAYRMGSPSTTLLNPDVNYKKPQPSIIIKSRSQGVSDMYNASSNGYEAKSSLTAANKYAETPMRALDYSMPGQKRHESLHIGQAHGNSSSASPFISSEPKGLVGLRNIGNTCFMNSILQCIMNAPVFSEYFNSGDYLRDVNQKTDKGIAKAFGDLVVSIKSHTGQPSSSAESTFNLKRKIGEANSMFNGYEQHDAQEFLKTLLEAINEDVNRVTVKQPYRELKAEPTRLLQNISDEWFEYMLGRDNSIVTDQFTGQLLSKTTCTSCGFKSLAFDNFWDLSISFTRTLPLIDKCDLMKMIEQFLKEETLEDMMNCENCKQKRKFKKVFVIWRLPKVLVIHLKRFNYGKYKKEKITSTLKFPVKSLDLSEYVKESTDRSVNNAKYSLFGVVNHSGSLSGGHYTADCMNPYNRKWYSFNDSNVKESHMITEKSNDAEGSSPYMLFYLKSS